MIVKTNILPKGIVAITIFPFIFTKRVDDRTINHERIHMKQQVEMFVIFFFIWYLIEEVFKGYYNISFEKEAYKNEDNFNYLKNRKLWEWRKYL